VDEPDHGIVKLAMKTIGQMFQNRCRLF